MFELIKMHGKTTIKTEERFFVTFISNDEQKCGNIKEGNPEIRIKLDKFRLSVLFTKPTDENS
jgi:hypothetical protein